MHKVECITSPCLTEVSIDVFLVLQQEYVFIAAKD
jgi:hypothetical protein